MFIPDTTGLDLREQERYWHFVREGRQDEYHGIAIHPRHVSLYEKVFLRRGRNYDPELDRKAKIQELRGLYNRVTSEKGTESGEETGESIDEKVSTYFDWEKTRKVDTI